MQVRTALTAMMPPGHDLRGKKKETGLSSRLFYKKPCYRKLILQVLQVPELLLQVLQERQVLLLQVLLQVLQVLQLQELQERQVLQVQELRFS